MAPAEADPEDNGERHDGEPDVESRVFKAESAVVGRDPEQGGDQREDKTHTKEADRAQRGS